MRIDIKGPIISDENQRFYDWVGMPATSPKKINSLIQNAKKGEKLDVFISSSGGSVFAGSEIFTELKSYKGEVEVNIVGIAASAASVIAMAGDKILMSPTGTIMIHNASSIGYGDHTALTKTAEVLKVIDESIANAYEMKTGRNHSELLELMGNETWLSLAKAKELNFVDGGMFDEETTFINNSTVNDGTIPQAVLEKMRNSMMKEGVLVEPEDEIHEIPENKLDEKILHAKARMRLLLA